MNLVIVSNYFNHHQKPFCDSLLSENIDLTFISTSQMREERRALGYGMNVVPNYVKYSYVSVEAKQECMNIIQNADIVIWGSAHYDFIKKRLIDGKLTFAYSERLYKHKPALWKLPIKAVRYFEKYSKYKNLYMLCASAYTSADYAKTGTYLGRTYKWGYFPEVKRYDSVDELISKKKSNSLLWVARFISWKHPELPILVAKRLKDEGYDFELNLIGNGVMEDDLKKLIKDNDLSDCVHLLGSMKPEKVRKYMELSQIFMFTSDRNEGWGAVLNESMNSACAVVSNHLIGSAPFLVEHEKNGLIYQDGNFNSLYNAVKCLLDDKNLCTQLGIGAYKTISELWNCDVAAKRLLLLFDELIKNGSCDKFENGPCSKATILKDNWFEG